MSVNAPSSSPPEAPAETPATGAPAQVGAATSVWGSALSCAAAVGVLLAIAEVSWSYVLPLIMDGWRAMLPSTFGGLLGFLVAALATDLPLAVLGGVLLAILVRLVQRVIPATRRSRRWTGFIRFACIFAGLTYLIVGWLGIFFLQSDQSRTWGYRLSMLGAVAATFAASATAAGILGVVRKHVHRNAVKVCWVAAVVVGLLSIVPTYTRHRGEATAQAAEVPVIPAAADRPNVLLITLDTLRADFLGCYGHPYAKTPALDALAADGTLFQWAVAQAPTTGPSHCSIMTSVYPLDHEGFNGRPMKAGLVTLADMFRAAGYETAAFTSATTTRSLNTGLQQGFDRYIDSLVSWSELFSHDEFQNLIFFYLAGIAQHSEIRGEVVTGRALNWLARRDAEQPFFAWLHYFDPHGDYDAPEPYKNMYRGREPEGVPMAADRERYAGEVSYTDAQVGRVLDDLRERGLLDRTIVIITADHGEAFGEQHAHVKDKGHGANLYDATQHVPLIIRAAAGRGKVIGEQVELTDVAPTALVLAGIEPPAGFVGKPLNELLEGRRYSHSLRPAFAFTTVGIMDGESREVTSHAHKLAMRTPDLKYISLMGVKDNYELYDLIGDPGETRDISERRPDVCEAREAELMTRFFVNRSLIAVDPRARIAPTLKKQLQTLGYMGDDEEQGAVVAPGRPQATRPPLPGTADEEEQP